MQTTPAPQDNPQAIGARAPRPAPARPIALSSAWLLFAALALALPIGAFIARQGPPPRAPPLPVLWSLPDFSLVDQGARPFARKDLLGRAWVADFVFTSCAGACPRLTATMRGVQDSLTPEERAGQIGLLSISVDPARDTPAVMRAYALAHGADLSVWRFLTGEPEELERAVVQGFKSAMEPLGAKALPSAPGADAASEGFDLMHGEKFVLVDPDGRIRGYYDVTEAAEVQRLMRDLRQLIRGDA